MLFLRFLRNDLSVKTSDRGRRLDRVKDAHAQSKSSSKLPSLCSTQRHNGALRQTLPYYGERNLCGWESCKLSPESESRVCGHSRLMQLRKKRIKHKKEPVWRSSTGASGLPR
jgi:hypothetical protein